MLVIYHRDKKGRSVLFFWAASYTLLLAILLLISVIIFIFSYQMIEHKETSIKQYELSAFQEQMDGFLNKLYVYMNNIQHDDTIISQLIALGDGKGDKSYHYYKINQELNRYAFNDNNLTIYLYFEDDDYLLSGSTGGPGDFVYRVYMDNGDVTYDNFRDAIRGSSARSMVFLKDEDQNYSRTILYISPFDYRSYQYNIKVKIICVTYSDELFKSITYPYQYGNSLFIRNGKPDIAFLSGTDPSISFDALSAFIDSNTTGNSDFVISKRPSSIYPLTYIMAIPSSIYQRDIHMIRALIIVGVSLILLFGFALIMLSVRRNYKPVKNLVQMIGHDPTNVYGNEYQYINSAFQRTLEDNREKTLALSGQTIALRNLYLGRILKGRERDPGSIKARISSYGMTFPYEHYIVFVLCVDNVSDDMSMMTDEALLIKEAGRLAMPGDVTAIFSMDDLITGIINFEDCGRFGAASASLITQIIGEIEENLHIALLYGQSDVHHSLAALSLAYAQAVQVVEYDRLTSGNAHLFVNLGENAESTYYHYPIEQEQYLINCVKAARLDEFTRTLHEMVEMNMSDQTLSVNALLCFKMELINTMVKIYDAIGSAYQRRFNPQEIAEKLLRCNNLRQLEQGINDFVSDLCLIINKEAKRPAAATITQRVMAYVSEHYNDPSLCNASIAEHLCNHPSYISSVFKAQYGIGINDYINDTRIGKAKSQLKETSLTIESIAQQVGYGSARTFIRVFKLRQAMTPTQYRELQ